MSLYVRQLHLGPKKNFVYLLGAQESADVAVVDPAWDVGAITAEAERDGKRIVAIFCTHSHDDHINGVGGLLEKFDVPVYAQRAEVEFSPALRAFGGALKPLAPSDTVEVGALKFRSLHTPGHTPGAQCLLCEDAVVTGDTVFVNKCGRCDFRGGDPVAMHRSIRQVLMQLPDATRLLPGHDYGDVPVSSIGREKQQNPYFQLPKVEDFVAFRMQPPK